MVNIRCVVLGQKYTAARKGSRILYTLQVARHCEGRSDVAISQHKGLNEHSSIIIILLNLGDSFA